MHLVLYEVQYQSDARNPACSLHTCIVRAFLPRMAQGIIQKALNLFAPWALADHITCPLSVTISGRWVGSGIQQRLDSVYVDCHGGSVERRVAPSFWRIHFSTVPHQGFDDEPVGLLGCAEERPGVR